MKTKNARISPNFQVGDSAKLVRFIDPLLSGSIVRILSVAGYGGSCRYQVAATEYQAEPVWVYEEDLEWVIA